MSQRGNIPCLTQSQARFVRSAIRIRRSLSTKALAEKLGVSTSTIVKYGNGWRGRGLGNG